MIESSVFDRCEPAAAALKSLMLAVAVDLDGGDGSPRRLPRSPARASTAPRAAWLPGCDPCCPHRMPLVAAVRVAVHRVQDRNCVRRFLQTAFAPTLHLEPRASTCAQAFSSTRSRRAETARTVPFESTRLRLAVRATPDCHAGDRLAPVTPASVAEPSLAPLAFLRPQRLGHLRRETSCTPAYT